MTCENSPNKALEDCLRAYNVFLSANTKLVFCILEYLEGIFMYISSSTSPWRRAFFTSYCNSGQSNWTTNAIRIQIVFILLLEQKFPHNVYNVFDYSLGSLILIYIFMCIHPT